MSDGIDSHGLSTLLQTAFLLNGGYGIFRKSFHTPLSPFVRAERAVRQHLKAMGDSEDANIKTTRAKLFKLGYGAENTLRFLLKFANFLLYASATIAFVWMVGEAFGKLSIDPGWALIVVVALFLPLLYTLTVLWWLPGFYVGRMEKALIRLAKASGAEEKIADALATPVSTERLTALIEAIESGGGGGKGGGDKGGDKGTDKKPAAPVKGGH